jgi:hypothetical protein
MSIWNSLVERMNQGLTNSGFRDPITGDLNSNRIGMVLGQMGADMSPKGSLGYAAGNAAANIGMSNIYGKAQEKTQKEKQAYMQQLIKSMGGLTEDGVAGPTNYSENADGTFTVKGNVGGAPGVGDTTSPTTPSTSPINPTGGGSGGDNPYSTLIKALGNFQDSPAGLTSADYAGLTPEMIDALAGRSAQGQEMGLRTLNFLNEMLGPKAGHVIEGAQNYMLVDPVSGKVRDLGIPVYRATEDRAPKTLETSQGIMKWNPETGKFESTGLQPYRAPSTERPSKYQVQYYNPKDGKQSAVLVDEYNYNKVMADLQSQGMVVGNAPTPVKPGDITEQERANFEAQKAAGLITPEEQANKTAAAESRVIFKQGNKSMIPFKSTDPEPITLPLGWNVGMVRKYADKYGLNYYDAYQAMLKKNAELQNQK